MKMLPRCLQAELGEQFYQVALLQVEAHLSTPAPSNLTYGRLLCFSIIGEKAVPLAVRLLLLGC